MLDEFEGDEYQRVQVKVATTDCAVIDAYVYAIKQ